MSQETHWVEDGSEKWLINGTRFMRHAIGRCFQPKSSCLLGNDLASFLHGK